MPILRRATPPAGTLTQPTSTNSSSAVSPRPFRAPVVQASPSAARPVTVTTTPGRSPAPYIPPKGRTEDHIRQDRCDSLLQQRHYPESKKPPLCPKMDFATPAKDSSPVEETSPVSTTSTTPGTTTATVPIQALPPSEVSPEDLSDVVAKYPPSVRNKFYFEVVQQEQTTKHSGTGIIVVSVEPDYGIQMFDRDGRQFGNRPGVGYPISPDEVSKLCAGHQTKIGTRVVTLRTGVKEEEFRSGSFFLDSQKREKERQQKLMLAAKIALQMTQVAKKSILLPNLPQGRTRCGLRGGGSFVVPYKGVKRDRTSAIGATGLVPLHDPNGENAVVLFWAQYKTDSTSRPIVSVVVDPVLGAKLRPHQVAGVQFLFECVTGRRIEGYNGCILADEMGLGKSIQAVSLIWTCLKQGMYGEPVTRRAMVVAPCSLVENWKKEFGKWLGEGTVKVHAIAESTPKGDKILSRFESEGDVLVISYDQLRKYVDRISSMKQVDLVVCDEGHKLKNAEIKTTKAVFQVPTKRRVILSGTPIQNDLTEFHAMVTFVNPGILGPLDVFCRVFEEPILKGREPSCEEEEKELGQDRAHFLSTLTSKFILRRTQTLNEKYLPAKVEMTVFCKMTPNQEDLYVDIITNRASMLSTQPFATITALRQLSSHIGLLVMDEASENKQFLTPDLRKKIEKIPESQRSGKLSLMMEIVSECKQVGDKIVIVSNFTQTLNLMGTALKAAKVEYFQLDGTTPIKKRQQFVDHFNAPSSREIVFLLSSKAGGVGLNLIGANRLILFDPDWNPANDAQAMGRVWRDGQKKRVFIYRFLSTGTIEEKVYMRQVSKQGLSTNIVDANMDSKQHFSLDDLRTLFTFNPKTICETHDLLNCLTCPKATDTQANVPQERKVMKFKPIEIKSKGPRMDELKAWNHLLPQNIESFDPLLARSNSKPIVSFVFAIARDPEKIVGSAVETEKQFFADSAAITMDDGGNDLDIEITQPNSDDDTDEE